MSESGNGVLYIRLVHTRAPLTPPVTRIFLPLSMFRLAATGIEYFVEFHSEFGVCPDTRHLDHVHR
jgi:hypothetical protein